MTTLATSSDTTTVPVSTDTRLRARDRLLGGSGLAFVAFLLPVVLIPHASLDYPADHPPSGSVITSFFAQHYALQQYQALMHSGAALMLLVFGMALARQVRRHQAPESVAAALTMSGAVLAAAVMLVTMVLVAGTVQQTGAVDGVTEGWFYNLGWEAHFKMLYAVPLLLLPACVVLGRARAVSRWLSITGSALAALALAAMVGGLSSGTEFLQFPVFFLLMTWVLATAVVALTTGVGTRAAARAHVTPSDVRR